MYHFPFKIRLAAALSAASRFVFSLWQVMQSEATLFIAHKPPPRKTCTEINISRVKSIQRISDLKRGDTYWYCVIGVKPCCIPVGHQCVSQVNEYNPKHQMD